MTTNGYVHLKKDINCSHAMGDPDKWKGGIFRAMEINEETKSVLLLSSGGTEMGMFDMSDVDHFFHCQVHGDIIVPKGLDVFARIAYISQRIGRKGGYDKAVSSMVVANSLIKGEVDDSFLNEKTQ